MHSAQEVEATEREAVLDFAELGDSIFVETSERVPLRSGLVSATDCTALHTLELFAGVIAQRVEA
jgi:hypothetical protein